MNWGLVKNRFKRIHLTQDLRPLHTQAKSCDYEIVRAQKKVSEGRPKTPPKACRVVANPQV